MFRHRRLHEESALRRIDSSGEQRYHHVARAAPEVVGRVRQRDCVIIDDTEKRFVLPLQRDPVLHGPQVVAYVQLAGRLNSAEDPGLCHRPKLTSERNALQGNEKLDSSDVAGLEQILEGIVEAAKAAAEVIRAASGETRTLEWESKGAADFVTEVDRASEAAIDRLLKQRFPDALVIGEELSPDAALSAPGLKFVVDPLDGTTNFLHRYPQYAVSIGALVDSDLVAAVVINVVSRDCFTATAGGGAFHNGKKISVSSLTDVSRALIGTGFPFKQQELLARYSRQFIAVSRETAGIRRAGSAALDLADVACGRFDGFWELDLAPWDIAAGILLVREAGGVVTSWDGSFRDTAAGPVVAGNPDIHRWLLATVRDAGIRDNSE
jgi:Archaeal fructose-1,6-bisphosphatase and related enzymes of inositol monophosphatase family